LGRQERGSHGQRNDGSDKPANADPVQSEAVLLWISAGMLFMAPIRLKAQNGKFPCTSTAEILSYKKAGEEWLSE
jgi:hypothetical protein